MQARATLLVEKLEWVFPENLARCGQAAHRTANDSQVELAELAPLHGQAWELGFGACSMCTQHEPSQWITFLKGMDPPHEPQEVEGGRSRRRA